MAAVTSARPYEYSFIYRYIVMANLQWYVVGLIFLIVNWYLMNIVISNRWPIHGKKHIFRRVLIDPNMFTIQTGNLSAISYTCWNKLMFKGFIHAN